MERLKLYTINADYIKYLSRFEHHVMHSEGDCYKLDRKYLGVVLKVNDFEYFAPLSSPKDSDYYYKDGKRIIRKSIIPIVRLVTDKGELLGKVVLGNMIPVKSTEITLYDLDGETDLKYKALVEDELICIRKKRKEIIRNAGVLYNQKIHNYEGINYLKSTNDFKTLEVACATYGEITQ